MRLFHFALAAILLAPCFSYSQTTHGTNPPPPTLQSEGFVAYEEIQVNSTPMGLVSSEDTDLGFNFNDHFGGDIGLPIFYTRSPLSLVTNSDWKRTTLFGDPYIDFHYSLERKGIKATSVLTGTLPLSSSVRVYSTGRAGVDWFNHIEPENGIDKVIPFLNFGVSNGTANRYYMPRPYSVNRLYQTFGVMGDGEAGASYEIRPGYKIGASAYGLLPEGTQKVFSRLVTPGSSVVGDGSHHRFFYSAFETIGPASIARDNGYSAWIDITSAPNVELMVGYTRSIHYHYDALNVVLKFDGTVLFRKITGRSTD